MNPFDILDEAEALRQAASQPPPHAIKGLGGRIHRTESSVFDGIDLPTSRIWQVEKDIPYGTLFALDHDTVAPEPGCRRETASMMEVLGIHVRRDPYCWHIHVDGQGEWHPISVAGAHYIFTSRARRFFTPLPHQSAETPREPPS